MSSMNTKYGNGYKDGFANGKAIRRAELMHRIAELEQCCENLEARTKGAEAENERLRESLEERTLQHKVQLDNAVRLLAENDRLTSNELPSWWDTFIRNVCELPNRTSPEDEPEAMVATREELESAAMDSIESEGAE